MAPDPIPNALLPLDASNEDVLYIADARLHIVFVNTAWRSFARANDGARILGAEWNSHLLDNFSGSERLRRQAIYMMLVTGQRTTHEENFICPSPVERRPYRLRIQRVEDQASAAIYLAHHATRVDQRSAVSTLGSRLRTLDDDPALMVETYKRLVQARPVQSARVASAQRLASLDEVGGDLLWHRDWAQGEVDLVIADVMGHGLDAARLAAKIVLLLESQASETFSAAENVAQLNQALIELAPPGARDDLFFATGLYLRIDPHMQSLTLCSFGHVGPIFSMSGYIQPTPAFPVGIVANETAGPWEKMTLHFADHGRRFVIFTDGISEQFNPAGKMFGRAGIEQAFRQALQQPLPQMVDTICESLDRFRANALVKDDQALLAIEVGAMRHAI